jgi:hypothetical protein
MEHGRLKGDRGTILPCGGQLGLKCPVDDDELRILSPCSSLATSAGRAYRRLALAGGFAIELETR